MNERQLNKKDPKKGDRLWWLKEETCQGKVRVNYYGQCAMKTLSYLCTFYLACVQILFGGGRRLQTVRRQLIFRLLKTKIFLLFRLSQMFP